MIRKAERSNPSIDRRETVDKAVKYLTMAGDQALENFSLLEARQLHEQALSLTLKFAASDSRGPVAMQRGSLLRDSKPQASDPAPQRRPPHAQS